MSENLAITGGDIFDGERRHQGMALLCSDGQVEGLVPYAEIPAGYRIDVVEGGLIASAYIDLQVNGGGGVLFNVQPDLAGIRTICSTHARFGTGALLPTLITDTPEVTKTAIEAGIAAAREEVPGFLGLHLEGPHLSAERKGAHDEKLIRVMEPADLQGLIDARRQLPNLMITVAPESVTNQQISQLSKAGIIVSLGHSNSTLETAKSAAEAGATCVTHLFNAMSPLTHREPGMVGAVLNNGCLYAGLIADGYHVDPTAISIALAAKQGPAKIFLVTDAMSSVGTDLAEFRLNGRRIIRSGGKLTLEDGTLAGADIDMHAEVLFMHSKIGVNLEECLRMASLYPAQCMGIEHKYGRLKPGAKANILHLSPELKLNRIWMEAEAVPHVRQAT